MLWSFKCTLMQIWKSPYMFAFISKQYPKNLALLTLIVLFLNVCKQTFRIISRAHISKSKRCFNVKSSTYYFYIKTRISADFQIWISVPLKFLCRIILPISWIYLQMIFLVFVYYCQVCKLYWYVKTHSFLYNSTKRRAGRLLNRILWRNLFENIYSRIHESGRLLRPFRY